MRVFISWSGEVSRQVALALHDWLPDVIQAIKPWMSVKDIQKGERWFGSLSEALQDAKGFGIFCITAGNMAAPWLLFEAGALGMADRGRVVTFLHGLSLGELQPPLGLFQGTVAASKDDVLKMMIGINKRLLEPLSDRLLEKAFESNWPTLENRLKAINSNDNERVEPSSDPAPVLAEILNVVRRIERDAPMWAPGSYLGASQGSWLSGEPAGPIGLLSRGLLSVDPANMPPLGVVHAMIHPNAPSSGTSANGTQITEDPTNPNKCETTVKKATLPKQGSH